MPGRDPHFPAAGEGYPSASPLPGLGRIVTNPANYYFPVDPANAKGVAEAANYAYALQTALENPRITALIQGMFDTMLRSTWKPVKAPPWEEFPYKARWIGGIIGSTIPGTGVWTTITNTATWSLSGTIPDGWCGVLKWIGCDVNAAGDWANLLWRIVVGGTPVEGFNLLGHQIGQIEDPWPTTIIVREGQTWAFQAQNLSQSNITGVIGRVHGWIWPLVQRGDSANAMADIA